MPASREHLIRNARTSYIYCNICGHTPATEHDEPNYAPLRWWDCDDGWKIGTLCRACWGECCDAVPKRTDFAYYTTNHICDNDPASGTDEDPSLAL